MSKYNAFVLDAAEALLKRMTARETYEFIRANLDSTISFEAVDNIRRKLHKRGESFVAPRPIDRAEPLFLPIDKSAAEAGCKRLLKSIATLHAKTASCPMARENWERVAAL